MTTPTLDEPGDTSSHHPSPRRRSALRRAGAGTGALGALLLLALLAWSSQLAGQEPPAEPQQATPAPRETTPAPTAVFTERVEVEVVNLEVFVTDRQGNPVTDLTAEDFQVFVEGEERPIVNFYSEVAGEPRRVQGFRPPGEGEEAPGPEGLIPLENVPPPERRQHLVIFVDNNHIQATNRNRVFEDLKGFLHALAPETLVSVVSLGDSLRVHSDFLSSRSAVAEILDELEKEKVRQAPADFQRRRILADLFEGELGRGVNPEAFNRDPLLLRIRAWAQSEYDRGRTSLDAVERFLTTLAGVPGRRALLWVADSLPQRPGEDLYLAWTDQYQPADEDYQRDVGRFDLLPQFQDVVRQANASRVTLYGLDAAGDRAVEVRTAAVGGRVPAEALSAAEAIYEEPQEYAAQATGGRRIEAGPELSRDLGALVQDFRTYYSLGFTPESAGEGNKSLEVRVSRPGVRVRHRQAFERRSPDRRAADATLAALLFGAGDNPLGVSLQAGERQQRDDGQEILPVQLQIPVDHVTLLPGQGPEGESFHATQLSLFVSVQGADGQPRPVQKVPFHTAIPDDKMEEARGESLRSTLPLVLRQGDRAVVVGVRDDLGGVYSAARLELRASRNRGR